MPKQEFIQPKRRRDRDDDGMYDDPVTPFSTPPSGSSPSSNPVSDAAQNTLGNIDDALRGAEQNPSSGSPPDDIAAAEGMSAPSDIPFNPNDKGKSVSIKALMKANRKKALIGGGALGGVLGLTAMLLFLVIPLKIESIVTNLENRFFATSENAAEKETNNMLSKYMQNHVLPSYKRCGSTISKACSVRISSTSANPVSNLYKAWSQAKLENKLAEDYGIEFKYDTKADTWYLKAPGTSANGDNIGPDGKKLDGEFKRADRAALRGAVGEAMQGETRWKKLMFHYKVGRLLEEKYGVKRCLAFCGTKDAFANNIDKRQKAAQILFVQRVVVPHTQTLGIALECLLSPTCEPESTQATTPEDGTNGALNGAPENPETDGATRTTLKDLAASYGVTDAASIDKMLKDYATLAGKGGYSKYALGAVLDKIGLSELTDNVSDSAPLIGWFNRASEIIGSLNTAGPKVRKLSFMTNSESAVKEFSMLRTEADEIHTGHVDAAEIGSFTKLLDAGDSEAVGGTASAEESPLYQDLMSGKRGVSSAKDICADGKPVPAGKEVCSEEVLGQGSAAADAIHDELNTPPLSYITKVASAWNSTVGKILHTIGDLLGKVINIVPGVSKLSDLVSKVATPFMTFLVDKLIPNPFANPDQSGARNFDGAAAGATVAGYDTCADQFGCESVSNTTAATIVTQQLQEGKTQFAQQSFFARMFSTDSPYSLVSKLAVALPFHSMSTAKDSFASLLSNPFRVFSNSFASIFSKTSALPGADNPFNVPTNAFPEDQIPSDPETYWDNADCGNTDPTGPIALWQAAAASSPVDPGTGMPVHKTTEPCLLIKTASGDAGGLYDTSLLSSDDLADDSGSSPAPTAPTTGTGTYQNPFRDVPNLGKSRVDQGVDYTGSGPVYALGNGKVLNITSGGWPGGTFIVYQLTDGPAQGKDVYMAENCSPIKVSIGDTVTPTTVLCTMIDASPHIETGWANDKAIGEAAAHDVWVGNDSDSYYTAYGKNFSELLQSLGAPPGIVYPGAQELGSLPSGWPSWQ